MPLPPGRNIQTYKVTGPIDTADLKARVDLLDLIGRDAPLKKVSGTMGGEWAGPHSACGGGTDRLRVQPERRRWWCRVCSLDEHWQDAIAYVMQRDGATFLEAIERLDGPGLPARSAALPREPKVMAEPDPEPSAAWRDRAALHVERCQKALWGPDGAEALAYLRQVRRLSDDAIRTWKLGWNADQVWEPRPQWGLAVEGDRRNVWIPRGITIPWITAERLWQLKVRRPDEDLKTEDDKRRRYISVAGGRSFLYGADTLDGHKVIVLTEGELDALLLWQEVRHLVGTATLGSAQKGIPRRALPYLLEPDQILLAYDADDPGEKGAGSLAALSGRMERIRPPLGKDVTEFVQKGGRLLDWINFHLSWIEVSN